jgi:hypothetical protein
MKLSKELLSFLDRLVDRMDAAELRGAGKAQSVPLSIKTWPELVNASFESDKEALWAEACQLHSRGWIRVTPEKAVGSTSGYARDIRISVLDPLAVRAAVGRAERVKSASERWRDAVNEHLAGPVEAKQVVGAHCIELAGRSMADVVQRLNELHRLKGQPLLLREVSAKLFWGISKVLDGRQRLVAAVLGQPECPFPESPIQLLVQLPIGELLGALFIENQMSFEQAARSGSEVLDGFALVYASGFKGSAQRIRNAEGTSVYYSNRVAVISDCRVAFESWLYAKAEGLPAYFWGDLDWSGMGILKTLRTSFPHMQAWPEGYNPMLQSLLEGQGHAPNEADKQGQISVALTGCPYADAQLIPALRSTGNFVDQELFVL